MKTSAAESTAEKPCLALERPWRRVVYVDEPVERRRRWRWVQVPTDAARVLAEEGLRDGAEGFTRWMKFRDREYLRWIPRTVAWYKAGGIWLEKRGGKMVWVGGVPDRA